MALCENNGINIYSYWELSDLKYLDNVGLLSEEVGGFPRSSERQYVGMLRMRLLLLRCKILLQNCICSKAILFIVSKNLAEVGRLNCFTIRIS